MTGPAPPAMSGTDHCPTGVQRPSGYAESTRSSQPPREGSTRRFTLGSHAARPHRGGIRAHISSTSGPSMLLNQFSSCSAGSCIFLAAVAQLVRRAVCRTRDGRRVWNKDRTLTIGIPPPRARLRRTDRAGGRLATALGAEHRPDLGRDHLPGRTPCERDGGRVPIGSRPGEIAEFVSNCGRRLHDRPGCQTSPGASCGGPERDHRWAGEATAAASLLSGVDLGIRRAGGPTPVLVGTRRRPEPLQGTGGVVVPSRRHAERMRRS